MIKTLARSIREYIGYSFASIAGGIAEVAFEVAIPFLMVDLINLGVEKGDLKVVGSRGVILIIMSILALLAGAFASYSAARAAVGFAKNLRRDLFYRVQGFSFGNINKFSSSSIITRVTTDVNNVQMAYQMMIRLLVRTPTMIIFAFVMAYRADRKLSLIYVVVVPVLAFSLFFIIGKVFPIFNEVFRTYDKLNNVVQENLRGIRVVKSFVREDYEVEKFKVISQKIYDGFVKAEKMIAYNWPLMRMAVYATVIVISWIGGRAVIAGTMTTGDLISLFSYTMMILSSLMLMSMAVVMVIIARASSRRIYEMLAEVPEITQPAEAVTTVKNGDIEFENVSFSYNGDPDQLCLLNVDLKINSGETVGIIGATGSSKTTLVQLIPRLYDATVGTVKVGGVDVKDYDMTTLRDQVAMVLQKNVLFSGTIKENLRWGNENATQEELVHAAQLAQAYDFIVELPDGFDSRVEQGGSNFSGGQQQRLCIARALLKRPKILILDDSTSAVDTKTDSKIREALYTEIPDTTKIIIAQRLASVEDADKIVLMDEGKIYSVGTHEELLKTNEIYRELHNMQMKGGGSVEG